jgi:hypothetical protein
MDACRDNPLARNLSRALGTRSTQIGRGFAPVESGDGTLISFSTQPGNVALDGTGRNSPYAAALLKHIVVPGDDLPTILINVRNDVMKATDRRQVPWEHSAMTARFFFTPPKSTSEQVELAFWTTVKDSNNPAVLATYLDRFPKGEFAPLARVLMEHYDRQLKLETAKQEEARKLQDEAKRADDVRRLEAEQRAKEAALAAERKRAEEAKNSQEAKRLEKERAELLARNEELRKALDEARKAREATKVAEDKRMAALSAAETATKAAEEAIAKKRDATKTDDAAKVAALPKIEQPGADKTGGARQFDGVWTFTWKNNGPPCRGPPSGSHQVKIANGAFVVTPGSGSVATLSASGAFRGTTRSPVSGQNDWSGVLRKSSGSGTWRNSLSSCAGTWVASRS